MTAFAAAISTVGMLALFAAPAQAAAPPNDNLAQAEPGQAGAVAGTLNESTFEPGEEAATGSVDAHTANWGTVWYEYTPAHNVSTTVRAAGKNAFQSKLKVFTGTGYADLALVSSDPPSPCPGGSFSFDTGGCETFAANSNTTYLIQVINHNISYAGNHNFDLTITESGVGSISGTVHDETNSPLAGLCVKSYTVAGTLHAQATTALDGTYTVPAPSGSDRVEFSDCNETTQAFTEWHNDKNSFATADAINVPAGGNTDIGVTKVQRGVRISGTVSADGGGPLSDACVTTFNATTGAQAAFEITAGDGAYDKLLPSGEYEVQYRDCSSTRVYAAEWFDDAFSQAGATTIDLEPGEAFDADAGLAPGGTISGTFSYIDPDDEDTCIEAHPAGGDGVTASAGATPDASDTSYELSGLAAGSYRIKIFSCDGPTPGPAVWGLLHHAFAFGQTVAVTAGGTTDLPLSFGDPTAVGAQVRDAGGAPIAGVCVDVYDAEDSTLLFGSATTNASGEVKVTGLTAGGYKLKFSDCGGFGFGAPVWFQTKSGFAGADVVTADWPDSPDDFPTVTQTLGMTPPDTPPPDRTPPDTPPPDRTPPDTPPPDTTPPDTAPPSLPSDDSACLAARAKLTAATKAKEKATAALKSAKAKRKPKQKIAKLRRKAKAAKKTVRTAVTEVAVACR